jgi:hypothetical protein
MQLLDGSPEVTRVVLSLAREHGERPFGLAELSTLIRGVSAPSPGGIARDRFERLFVEGLIRCGYVGAADGNGHELVLTPRAVAYYREYVIAESTALNRLAAAAGITPPTSEPAASPAPATCSIFEVTEDLLTSVLAEAGLPRSLLETVLEAYRGGKVYLTSDGGTYRFVV